MILRRLLPENAEVFVDRSLEIDQRWATTQDLSLNVAGPTSGCLMLWQSCVLGASSTRSAVLRCATQGRAAIGIPCVPPQRRVPTPHLQQRIPETDRLPARTDDAVAPPASANLAKEPALNRHKFPSIRQMQRQPAREGQAVITRGLISQRAFPEAA